MNGTDQSDTTAASREREIAQLRAAVETVRKERDEAMQRQHTVERERDAARRQSDDCTRRYQQDMHAARGRIGELEEQVRRQGVLIGLAGLGLVGAWVWKLR